MGPSARRGGGGAARPGSSAETHGPEVTDFLQVVASTGSEMTTHEWLRGRRYEKTRCGSSCRVPAAESTASSQPFSFPPSTADVAAALPGRAVVTQGFPRARDRGAVLFFLLPGRAAAGGSSLG